MGYYLNTKTALSIYEYETKKRYFVDKTEMLRKLIPSVEEGNNHICITRPRRFGKSIMAAMVAAFFGKGADSSNVFDSLKIAGAYVKKPEDSDEVFDELNSINYRDYMNQYNVIYINFIEFSNISHSYEEFINRVNDRLSMDLRRGFKNVDFWDNTALREDMTLIFEETGEKFVLVLDEWDCVFHKEFMSNGNKKDFINWLVALTKDTGYVALTYMTGVLPITKYSSGSSLNNFTEYTITTDDLYSEYFGFSEEEVDELYLRYEKRTLTRNITRNDLKEWYDGYHTPKKKRMYNPRSVVEALTRNSIRNYWRKTGSYDEIYLLIKNDIDDIKKDVALMVAGETVTASVEEYAATSMNLNTRNEILSAMVVYGFLDCFEGKVRIPNKELMDEFAKTIREKKDLGYVNRLAVESDRMLQATLKGDTKTMEEILQFAHDTETPLLDYNNETELTAIVNLVYLSSRDTYRVEREDKAGEGYVDFIFYPQNSGDDGIILELKVDDTPEAAIGQIKDRNYALKFTGKIAEKERYTGSILLVGIGYSKKDKEHHCKVERMMLKDIKATEKKKTSTGRRL